MPDSTNEIPKKSLEDRIIGLYGAVLFQACVCNVDGEWNTLALPGGSTPALPLPTDPNMHFDWGPILPTAGPLQHILWARHECQTTPHHADASPTP